MVQVPCHSRISIVLCALCALLLAPHELPAQNYVENAGRYEFAQTYVGFDTLFFPSLSTIHDPLGSLQGIPPSFSPRLTIGGLHFWGYADFYVSFPVYTNRYTSPPPGDDTRIYSGVETGFHFYPWQLVHNSLRPFIGISWNVLNFQQAFANRTKGSERNLHRFPIVSGLSYYNRWGQIDLSARYVPNPTFEYYVTETEKREYRLLPFSVGIGYKYLFDTTAGLNEDPPAIRERERVLRETGRLSGVTLGAGLSSAIPITALQTDAPMRAFLNVPPTIAFNPDISVGFHIHKIDAEVRSTFRFMYLQQDGGFGVNQTFLRFAASLELIKFLFDYHGFVPFLGVGAEFNYLTYRERSASSLKLEGSRFGVPIVFGWDIRPHVAVNWLLRTNLRYNPLLNLEGNGVRAPFDHFEFNFIQFVYYLGR